MIPDAVPHIDINPILDEEAPTSTGGIINAATVSEALSRVFKLKPLIAKIYKAGAKAVKAQNQLWRVGASTSTVTMGKPDTFT